MQWFMHDMTLTLDKSFLSSNINHTLSVTHAFKVIGDAYVHEIIDRGAFELCGKANKDFGLVLELWYSVNLEKIKRDSSRHLSGLDAAQMLRLCHAIPKSQILFTHTSCKYLVVEYPPTS